MAHSTAPQGYQSNYSALLDLIRFGYGIWTPTQMAVLLFHAERSTANGRESDQHSKRQATEGIYSARNMKWVRGPAGVSAASWHRANAELEQNEERPDGVLRRLKKQNRHGKDDPTEYEIDWPAVRRALEKWQGGVSHSETLTVSQRDTQCPSLRHTQEERQSTRIRVSQGETHSQTDYKSFHRSVSHTGAAAHIAAAIEQASGERPRTDRLIQTILQTGERLQLPTPAIVRWIHDKCQDLRAAGRLTSAGVLGTCAGDMIPWMRKPQNRNLIEHAQREERLAAARAAEVLAMPAAEPGFAAQLLEEVTAKKKARA